MARGVNKVILIGNLGNDPEQRSLPDGTATSTFSIATSESWKDRQTGEKRERTEWHRISIIGKLAEIANQYLKKGSKVYVEGQLRTRKWQDNSGQDRYTTEVSVGMHGQVQMLDGRSDGDQSAPQSNQRTNRAPTQQSMQQPTPSNFDDFDDIPF